MNPYIEIIRPGNVIMALIAIILVAIIGNAFNISLLFTLLAVFFAISAGNVINDVFDYKIDLINRPDRPIPSGRISIKNGRNYAYSLFILSNVFGIALSVITINIIPELIVLFVTFCLYIYAAKLKTTPLLGNFLVAFMTCLCFIFGGCGIGFYINNINLIFISIFLGFFALLATMAREIVKDMEDMEGDLKEGAKTFPILFGNRKSSIIASVLIIMACILSPILYFFNIFSIYYLFIVAIAVIIFLYGVFLILKSQDPKSCHKVSKLFKIAMIVAFVAFAIGSF